MTIPELTRADPASPGLSRVTADGVIAYLRPDGQPVSTLPDLDRIARLSIPTAWTNVWISPLATDHLQALGTDAGGKRQYLYHSAWQASESRLKFDRALDLAEALLPARQVVDGHLRLPHPSIERTLAAAFRMLDTGSLRVGSEKYAQEHGSFGLSTLLGRHAVVRSDTVHLAFPAKSHHAWESDIEDARLARVIGSLKRRGREAVLLAYEDGSAWVPVRADHINAYVRERTGGHFTAKDFRTLHGTLAAARSLASTGLATTDAARAKAVTAAVHAASAVLENTPAVAKGSYVDPRLIDIYLSGSEIDLGAEDGAEARLPALLRGREIRG